MTHDYVRGSRGGLLRVWGRVRYLLDRVHNPNANLSIHFLACVQSIRARKGVCFIDWVIQSFLMIIILNLAKRWPQALYSGVVARHIKGPSRDSIYDSFNSYVYSQSVHKHASQVWKHQRRRPPAAPQPSPPYVPA